MRKSLLILTAVSVFAQDPAVRPQGYHFEGPRNPADFPKWIADMKRWRTEYLKRIGYNGSEDNREELKWTQSSFIQPQTMIEDRSFYDPATTKSTSDPHLPDPHNRSPSTPSSPP